MNRTNSPPVAPERPSATDDAFVALYRDRRDAMVRLAVLMVDRTEVAEELVQEAFAAAYRRWSTLDEPAAFLRTTVVNRCRDELRRRQTRRLRPLGNPDRTSDHPDHLRDVITALPERARAIVVLRFYEDLTLDEIATVVAIPVGTVKSTLHRALAHMKKEVER